MALFPALEAGDLRKVTSESLIRTAASHASASATIGGAFIPGHQNRSTKGWVSKFTIRPIHTHPSQVLCTQCSSCVSIAAAWAMLAEAAVIPWTICNLFFWTRVKENTVFVCAFSVVLKETEQTRTQMLVQPTSHVSTCKARASTTSGMRPGMDSQALGHPSWVINMQEVTIISTLAKATEPMFADYTVPPRIDWLVRRDYRLLDCFYS
mmetsp:Transcript_25337/g.71258  ORF Transcript_25337/g.71258 Transcript_25337/m.71258 type:complete len:209 (+) Transcript_25337:305-931(+)